MEHTWIVWKNNRIVGHVKDLSEFGAYRKARERFGNDIWIEKA